MKLVVEALVKYLVGLLAVAALVFVPAGSLNYPGGLLLCGLLFAPMLIMGVVMFIKAPELLKKRLNNKEKERAQKGVVKLSGLMFLAIFVLSALDFRFGWSSVSTPWVVTASVAFLVGYGMYAEVMRENAYLSRTVEVREGQCLVDSGLYAVVRHPMYLATLLMFLPMPLILGSFWGLIPAAVYPILMVARILNEEKLLCAELEGYEDYKKRTKFRLIPFIW